MNGAAATRSPDGAAALDAIDAIQLEHGVTSYLPTIVADGRRSRRTRRVAELAERAADPRSPVAGVHLEGPFLSREHAGHAPRGSPALACRRRARRTSRHDAVRLVTLAPELPGALELIAALRAPRRGRLARPLGRVGRGRPVAPSTPARASSPTCSTPWPRSITARPALSGWRSSTTAPRVGVIADGLHVDPLVLELVRRAAGPRVVLVSDATPAAAAPPGTLQVGRRRDRERRSRRRADRGGPPCGQRAHARRRGAQLGVDDRGLAGRGDRGGERGAGGGARTRRAACAPGAPPTSSLLDDAGGVAAGDAARALAGLR